MYSWSGKTLAISFNTGYITVWVSSDDGDTWTDESGDYTALTGGTAQCASGCGPYALQPSGNTAKSSSGLMGVQVALLFVLLVYMAGVARRAIEQKRAEREREHGGGGGGGDELV